MHVPPPEVPADETGLRGSAESQWVVDLHTELLERANVGVTDARPSAWFETGKINANGIPRTRVTDWLSRQFAPLDDEEDEPELVLKDPRMAWFLGLWKAAAMRCDATPAYLTTLRHVTEVVGTRDRPVGADRRLGQHDAAHRARHPRLAACLRQVRRPAGRLDDPAVPGRHRLRSARGHRGLGQQHAQGPPVRRPGPAPRPPHVVGPGRPAAAPGDRRGELAGAVGSRRPRRRHRGPARDPRPAARGLRRALRRGRGHRRVHGRRRPPRGRSRTEPAEPKGLKRLLGR